MNNLKGKAQEQKFVSAYDEIGLKQYVAQGLN